MCDYSLHNVASRPAKVGDKLVTTKFYGTLTRGFAAVEERNVAVCLLPGTEVAFEKEAKRGGFWRSESIGQKTAIFRQLNSHIPGAFHDALEFANGEVVLVARLKTGQRATVLQLPVSLSQNHEASKAAPVSVSA